jgi:5-formyltetrahydrofolate cyclo-ligase
MAPTRPSTPSASVSGRCSTLTARFSRPGRTGTSPSFVGADHAAERLAAVPAWKSARVIKVNPDKAQLPVRARALADGKTVYMAVPKLAAEKPFYLLDLEILLRSRR